MSLLEDLTVLVNRFLVLHQPYLNNFYYKINIYILLNFHCHFHIQETITIFSFLNSFCKIINKIWEDWVTFLSFQNYIFGILSSRTTKYIVTTFSTIETMFISYMTQCPSTSHWISTKIIFSRFCCWRFFWIVFTVTYFLTNETISA